MINQIGWGPRKWYEIHTKTLEYPEKPDEKEKEDMKTYILNLYKSVGCGSCKRETQEYINKFVPKLDIICSSRTKVFKFFVDFHNVINEKLHKPKISYYQAYLLYQIDKILHKTV